MMELADPGRLAGDAERMDVAVAGPLQFSNEIASLKVAAIARMNSCSSMLSSRWNVRIGGTVDSPTPTVPICSDSTRMISRMPRNCCDSAAAAIQPAVPPPAMTTLRIFIACHARSLRAQRLSLSMQHRPDLPREASRRSGPSTPRAGSGKMFAGAVRRAEDVVVEDVAPGLLLALGPVAQRPDQRDTARASASE